MTVNEVCIGWALKQPNPAAALQRVIDNVRNWGRQRSDSFSLLAGEDFTRSQVVKAHLYLVFVFLMIGLASWLEGGAA